MTIAAYPHHYSVELSGDRVIAAPRASIQVGLPPQFGGTAQAWSPEEFFVSAVLVCVKTTFEAYARSRHLEIHHWCGSATGVLDRSVTGAIFTAIRVELDVQAGLGTEERIRELLQLVARTCIISRAIRVPVEVVLKISEVARAS